MTVAVMQPYIFPYIGYFQLIKSCDVFVLYDDVNFIKQGWVNRNRVLVSGKELMFTIPLKDASSFAQINETEVNIPLFEKWRGKFLRTIDQSYKKAPYFEVVSPMIAEILNQDSGSIADLAKESILKISCYLGLKTKFETASEHYPDTKKLDRENRLIEIIRRNDAQKYTNPIGGQELYTKESFANYGIELSFIRSAPLVYTQFEDNFVPWLSIIDVLMFNSPAEVNKMLDQYELI